jgi:hypothetical protein
LTISIGLAGLEEVTSPAGTEFGSEKLGDFKGTCPVLATNTVAPTTERSRPGMARLAGIEPPTLGFGGQYSIH